MTEFETNTRRLGLAQPLGQLRMTEFVTPPPATHPPFPADAWRPPVSNRIADPCDPWVLANRISVLEHRLSAMTAERDHALLRMEVAVATSHAWIDAEVRRRIAEAGRLPAFPANALRQQSQPIGLLSTADAGRVRLGGYAPSLPPR